MTKNETKKINESIENIYAQITNGLKDGSLSFAEVKVKMEEANVLIMELEKLNETPIGK
jgi:hypothetical protein